MFVDLVGSSALSGRLDPEDMRTVITGYQNAVAGVAEVACCPGLPPTQESSCRRDLPYHLRGNALNHAAQRLGPA
jgi:hypothetical protein